MLLAEVSPDRTQRALRDNASAEVTALAVHWLTAFVFLVSSSILFAWLFEWDRYHVVTTYRIYDLAWTDKALVFWLLVAKSLVWFVPVLPVCAVLILCGFARAAVVTLNCFWIGIFYFMAADLVSVSFQGYHAWDYLPPLRGIRWQWFADRLTADTLLIFYVFVISGPLCYGVAYGMTSRVGGRYADLGSPQAASVLAGFFLLIAVGVVPSLIFFRDRAVPDRVFEAMALPAVLRESLPLLTHQLVGRSQAAQPLPPTAAASAVGSPSIGFDAQRATPGDDRISQGTIPRAEQRDVLVATRMVQDAASPAPADFSAFIERSDLPNVILIVFESFRSSAVGPELMGELDAWSRQGLRLDRHFSGCNASHLALFSLFYARSSLGYSQNLDRKIPPQFFESFRRSGYQITLLTSGEIKAHRRMGDFINENTCDRILVEGEFDGSAEDVWPDSDRRKLARLKSMLDDRQDRPQLVLFYLLSSHYQYLFPPEFEVFKEPSGFRQFFDPQEQQRSFVNRYSNSLLFLQHELMKVLRSIDLKRNIVVITGDHGESMGEDGVFVHGSRMSEIQMRVPCLIVGDGVTPRRISTATTHADLLPTLLHVLAGRGVPIGNCHGRDLIADPSPADEVVLAPANGPEWEGVMIVRGDRRIVFRTDTSAKPPWLEFAGLVDAKGQFEWQVEPSERVRYELR
ncbi:MAG: sulfatase-like hydrolase/transferase [Desulfomonile tiedjei]|nr:sulfatase-like hydrolase/transferase [Desulfomonile tiedjei]